MLACFLFVWMYLVAAPVVGQLFGDKYPFAAVWPSALLLASMMSAAFVGFALTKEGKPMTMEFALFGVFAFVFFTMGLTLFVCLAHYVMPRAAGLGMINWPKLSWGVQL
jgi:CHASE2 domain-containing sensor protein